MKRILGLLVALIILTGLFAGCSSNSPTGKDTTAAQITTEKKEEPKTEEPAKKTNLKLYFWDETFTDVTNKTIADFQSKNPGYVVESTCIPWAQYWVKMPTLINSGVDLDLFWANALNAVEFADKSLLMPLDTAEIDTKLFAPAALSPFRGKDGKLYGVPIFCDVVGLIYNKELFDKAKVSYPTDDWTWDDLGSAAEKLTIRDAKGEAQQWGIYIPSMTGTWDLFYTYVYQSGSDIFTADGMPAFNNDNAKAGLKFAYDLVNVSKVTPNTKEVQELNSDELFASGKVAMITATTPSFTTQVQKLGDKVDCVQLPAGKREGTPISPIAYVASKNPSSPEGVQAFMDYLATKAPNEIMAQKNTPAMIGTSELWLKQFPNANVKCWVDPLETTGFPCPYVKKQNSQVWSIISTEVGNIMSDIKTMDQGLNDLEKQIADLQK